MILYHFCCEHSARRIEESGRVIVPHMHPVIGAGVVWMTHDPNASRDALGLSSHMLSCDRMTVRFEIATPEIAVPWNRVRDNYRYAHLIEATRGTKPDLWFVSKQPQSVTGRDDL